MNKHRFTRALAAFMATLLVVQSFSQSVYAADGTENASAEPAAVAEAVADVAVTSVVISPESSKDEVNQILSDALGTDLSEWEYYCEGKSSTGLATNSSWGSIAGFTSSTTTKLGFITTTTKYTHPSLAANNDGDYQVRVTGTEQEYTIEKKSDNKVDAPLTLKSGASAALALSDGALDVDGTKTNIFYAVVESTDSSSLDVNAVDLNDVTITYYATATSGSLGSMGKAWISLGGGKNSGLTYPAISVGEQTIKISWTGNDSFNSFESTVTVNITSGLKTPIVTLNDSINPVKLTYQEDLTVDYATLKSDIFDAVISSIDPELSAEDVTITYYASASTGSLGSIGKQWMPLTGGTKDLLTYPAISAGDHQVKISWDGNSDYEAFTETVNLTIVDRDALIFNLKEATNEDGSYEVSLVYNAEQGIDYDATAAAILDAVVASTTPEVTADELTVKYNATLTGSVDNYKSLNNTDTLTKKFGAGTWSIKISWGGNSEYAGSSKIVTVNVSDNREASAVVLKDGVSFTYNKDVNAMKQEVFDNVIDWDNSVLPEKDSLSIDDFTFTYYADLSLLDSESDGASSDIVNNIVDSILGNTNVSTSAYVPFEGQSYSVGSATLGSYSQIGAGEQQIRVVYNGNAQYKPSEEADGTVTINKASVSVSVKSESVYLSDFMENGLNITFNPDDNFDVYTIYAGITSNVTTAIYLDLPARYTNSTTVQAIDSILAGLGQKTMTDMMNDGVTISELVNILSNDTVLSALGLLGVDTDSLSQIISVINKLPSVAGNLNVAIGTPKKAGLYTVAAITDDSNYNTGVGIAVLVLKADKATLSWNQSISKISAADAASTDFGATLMVNDSAAKDQSSVYVLYSGVTSKYKVYSSTTTAPTEAGRYTQTVVILGGNYVATPITRSFQITK
jgi:hypothetical protein